MIVSAEVPDDIVKRIDVYLAERRLSTLRSGQEDSILPTRSSFLREAILAKLTNGKK